MRSTRRAARSKRCARARRGWRSRCSNSRVWAPGSGQPGRTGQSARAGQGQSHPLGRPRRYRGTDYDDANVKVPGEIDVQRARRILKELRRRFADPPRPQIEESTIL